VTILFITGGRIETLAGVYTLSFLSVMSLFAIGNMLLKVRRGRLPRETRAGWPAVTFALLAVLIGLIGNVVMDPLNVEIFAAYFLAVAAVVAVMFLRIPILRTVLTVMREIADLVRRFNERVHTRIRSEIDTINGTAMLYFTKGDKPAVLNRAVQYVLQNEQTNRLKVVHVYEPGKPIPQQLAEHLTSLDRLYPELRIDFIAVQGSFGPNLIDALSRRLHIPKNQMFIGTPGAGFAHRIETLGGVRLIL
jgi:hypothetical protein